MVTVPTYVRECEDTRSVGSSAGSTICGIQNFVTTQFAIHEFIQDSISNTSFFIHESRDSNTSRFIHALESELVACRIPTRVEVDRVSRRPDSTSMGPHGSSLFQCPRDTSVHTRSIINQLIHKSQLSHLMRHLEKTDASFIHIQKRQMLQSQSEATDGVPKPKYDRRRSHLQSQYDQQSNQFGQ